MSSPKDPDVPSFLTTLPPEVRNTIYEVLFKRDGSVLIHNAAAYHAKEPQREDYASLDIEKYHDDVKEFDAIYEQDIGGDFEFRHHFQYGLSLLLSCRQVYHEAIGILYGANTFLFSRVQNRHNKDDRWHQGSSYSQLSYAPKWLSSIGSHFALVRGILIDVDEKCPYPCIRCTKNFNLLPFLPFLRRTPDKFTVTFVHAGGVLYRHDHQTPLIDLARLLNNVLTSVMTKDALQLRHYACWNSWLYSIAVKWNWSWRGVLVSYRRANSPSHAFSRHFNMSDDGTTITPDMAPPPREHSLYDLDYVLWHRCWQLACTSPTGITFDLDTRTVHGLNMSALQLNRQSRYHYQATIVAQHNDITVKATSAVSPTSFNDFAALVDLAFHNDYPSDHKTTVLFDTIAFARSDLSEPMDPGNISRTFALNFDLATFTPLSEIRIDVKRLIAILVGHNLLPSGVRQYLGIKHYPTLHLTTTIRTSVRYPKDTKTAQVDATFSVEDLAQSIFLLLSDFLQQCPLENPRDLKLPEIWIDGNGKLLRASYPATDSSPAYSVDNRHTTLRKSEILQRGYRMSRENTYLTTRKEEKSEEFWITYERCDSLVHFLQYLRDIYWKDWRKGRPLKDFA